MNNLSSVMAILLLAMFMGGCATGPSRGGSDMHFSQKSEYREMEALGDISRVPTQVPRIRVGY